MNTPTLPSSVPASTSANSAPERPQPAMRQSYAAFERLTTRWSDNDIYGHVNNVVYYSWFDTGVNQHLIRHGVLDIHQGTVIGLVIETQCNYFAPLAFPQDIDVGIRVAQLGRSSVRYEVGIFAAGESNSAARGHFIHVYVDKDSRKPVPLPENLRDYLQTLCR